MNILVAVASKHGATGEIGEIVAGVLRDAGLTAETRRPQDVMSLDGYDAVVLGSAIYAGRWLDPARAFADRHATALATRPVWLFSSGPLGNPPMPPGQPAEPIAVATSLGARAHRSFNGRLDPRRLGLLERILTRAVRAPDGDFRDWEAIRAWADEIVAELTPKEVMT
jgi:menaquinone-dependent protoporphyrinogen oxidase